MKSKIAEDLGRLFEVGFNIGVIAYIQEQKIKHKFGDLYRQELQQLKLSNIQQRFVAKVISTVEREMAKKWSIFFIQKGFLSGFNFFREYIKSTGWDKPHKLPNVEILYYQCRFNGDNSIGTYDTKDDSQWFREVLSQFDNLDNIPQYITKYKKKGEFLNADTLILLRHRKEDRVICVDLSVFSINSNEDVEDIDYIAIIRRLLMRDISYLRSKSVFSSLRIDTESLGLEFSEGLKTYFTAFKYRDKESTKSIQAACYLHSFYEFLQKTTILPDTANLVFNSIGYSDRGISTISIQRENVDILKTCYQDFVIQSTTESNYLALQKSFNSKFSEISHTLDKLLDFGKLEPGYISGGLLVVPIANNKLEETYQMRLADITTYANEELWKNMHEITRRKSYYPENLRFAIQDAIELVKNLKDDVKKTQRLEQSSQHNDQYYALPLFAFISGEVMKEYFENEPQEPEDQLFRDILSTYIRSLYPVGNVLPIGHNYKEFPFVVFRSYSLEEIRNKIFTEKYLLNSHELNVLNLILSS